MVEARAAGPRLLDQRDRVQLVRREDPSLPPFPRAASIGLAGAADELATSCTSPR